MNASSDSSSVSSESSSVGSSTTKPASSSPQSTESASSSTSNASTAAVVIDYSELLEEETSASLREKIAQVYFDYDAGLMVEAVGSGGGREMSSAIVLCGL